MCQYCDEKALPCLMCGRACMEYQLDRTRCRGCAVAHRPPDVWPVFRFCPYCGRDLGKKENQNENQNQGEEEMARLIWTAEMDETVRRMEADGASDAEICEALGIEKTQLKNRRYNLQYNERKTCDPVDTRKYEGPEQADDAVSDMITKEKALETLDKLEFFQGQRAGRELWFEKSSQLQDIDIACFVRDISNLREYIQAADIAPSAKDDQGGGILSDTERGLVRLVEEKEEEICKLQRINRVLEESVDGFRMRVGELMALINKKDRVIGKMAEQIYGEV